MERQEELGAVEQVVEQPGECGRRGSGRTLGPGNGEMKGSPESTGQIGRWESCM